MCLIKLEMIVRVFGPEEHPKSAMLKLVIELLLSLHKSSMAFFITGHAMDVAFCYKIVPPKKKLIVSITL